MIHLDKKVRLVVGLMFASSLVSFNWPSWSVLPFLCYLGGLLVLCNLPKWQQTATAGLVVGALTIVPTLQWFWPIYADKWILPGLLPVVLWGTLVVELAGMLVVCQQLIQRFGDWGRLVTPLALTGLMYICGELLPKTAFGMHLPFVPLASSFLAPLVSHFGGYGLTLLMLVVFSILHLIWRLVDSNEIPCGLALIAFTGLIVGSLFHRMPLEPSTSLGVAGIQLASPSADGRLHHPDPKDVLRALSRLKREQPHKPVYVLPEYTLEGQPEPGLERWTCYNNKILVVGGRDEDENNTIFVIGPDGEVFRQGKSCLVPFLEDDQTPANERNVCRISTADDIAVGILDCNDINYGWPADDLVRQGAQILIVPALNMECWGSQLPDQEVMVARLRAVEYHIWVVYIAAAGRSVIVNPSGQIVAQGGFPGQSDTVAADLLVTDQPRLPVDRHLFGWLAALLHG